MRLACWLFVLTLLGCGDDASGTVDGGDGGDGGSDGSTDAGVVATPPDIPWLEDGVPPIALAPCSGGWREVTGGDVTECSPYPEGGAEACSMGEAHFPGEAGCRAIGEECPAGDYATTLPTGDRILYVKAGAPAGGDGSVGSPYAMLSEVSWLSVTTGTTVAVAKGSYEGTLPLRSGAHVVGACAAETIITGVDAPIRSVVTVTNVGVPAVVENLAIVGAPQRGVTVEAGRSLDLRGVLVTGVRSFGVVAVDASTAVTLTDVVIEGTVPDVGRPSADGIDVERGARFEATRVLVARNGGLGIFVAGPGSMATLTDVVVRGGGLATGAGVGDRGVSVMSGAQLEASRLLVTSTAAVGILVNDPGSSASLSDTIVEATQPRFEDTAASRGIEVGWAAHLDASRVLVSDNHDVGVLVHAAGTTVSLTDIVVRDTLPRESDGLGGRGIAAQDSAHIEGQRLLVSGNHESGLFLASAVATVRDIVIRNTVPAEGAGGQFGRGIEALLGTTLDATHMLVSENHDIGLSATDEGTVVTLTDVIVRDTRPQLSDDSHGRGIAAQTSARIEGARVVVDGARETAMMAALGAVVDLRDVTVTRVERGACVSADCPPEAYGYGVAALSGTVRLERFQVEGAATCGVFVAPIGYVGDLASFVTAPSLDLVSGVVSESEIGACVQVDAFDFDRLTNDVHYRNNGTNLSATMLPVPGAIGAIGR